MENNTIKKWITYSVSGAFTILSQYIKNYGTFCDIKGVREHIQGVFSLCKQTPGDDYIYLLVSNKGAGKVKKILSVKDFYITSLVVDSSTVFKLNRHYWYTDKEWEEISKSKYTTINAPSNNLNDILWHIKNNTSTLKVAMELYLNVDSIPENNIYWKPFIIKNETLDLSKIDEFNMEMKYNKKWLLGMIKNSPSYLKIAYKEVLDNSELIDKKPLIVQEEWDTNGMLERIRLKVKEIYGKRQIHLIVKGTKHPIIPNAKAFETRINDLRKDYNPESEKKVEMCLMNFLDEPNSKMINYIMKKDTKTSSLMDDYEALDDLIETDNKYKDLNTDELY